MVIEKRSFQKLIWGKKMKANESRHFLGFLSFWL